ncbi:MocR-like pyridoxine biosynthesis transcription factor PdxR [Rhodanobacter lindaniclasticus]
MYLNLDGEGPAYGQLTRAFKAAILDGSLGGGTRLPPSRALAQELGMSRITVLSAYDQLRAEGYLQSRVGSGSYVSELQLTPPLRPPKATPTVIRSRYAERAVLHAIRPTYRAHQGLRFELQFGETQLTPPLNNAWGRELARAASYTSLERTSSWGLPALREQVCRYLANRRGVQADPADVMIVSGSQQAFGLAARVLLNEGDPVVMEDPHYFGAWRAFAAHGAELQAVRTDDEGLVCAELPEVPPRLIFVTPSHQFPSGPVMSLPRRLKLLRYAETNNCWIMEDDYDSEFRYDSQPLAALRSLDEGDRVIYVGTFSKVLFGSLRLGYMVLPAVLREDFANARYLSDMGGLAVEQAALAHFMESGAFERHLRKVGKALKQRREVMLEGLRQHAGDRVRVNDSPAGMHVLAWLPGYDHAQLDALIGYAHEHGLGLYPVAPCYQQKPAIPGLILGYCGLPDAELREAMRLFGACLDAIDARRHEPV